MKKYYEHEADSDYGTGMAYVEIDGRWVSRQIEIYDNQVFWAERDGLKSGPDACLSDQPFEHLGLTVKDEIPAEKFVKLWQEATNANSGD